MPSDVDKECAEINAYYNHIEQIFFMYEYANGDAACKNPFSNTCFTL